MNIIFQKSERVELPGNVPCSESRGNPLDKLQRVNFNCNNIKIMF